MLMRIIITTVLSGVLFLPAVSAAHNDADDIIKVEVVPNINCNANYDKCNSVWQYTIFSLVDGLIVKNAIVNNGKCAIRSHKFGRLLQEDDYAELWVRADSSYRTCRPKSIYIGTNKGSHTFTFER